MRVAFIDVPRSCDCFSLEHNFEFGTTKSVVVRPRKLTMPLAGLFYATLFDYIEGAARFVVLKMIPGMEPFFVYSVRVNIQILSYAFSLPVVDIALANYAPHNYLHMSVLFHTISLTIF